MMNKLIEISAVIVLLAGCTTQSDRSDKEMFEIANEMYQDYFFEYGIDSKLFAAPIIESRQNGLKSYKWIAMDFKRVPIGVEVVVPKKKSTKPEMILIGNTDAWLPFVGSKNKKQAEKSGSGVGP